MVLNSVQRFEQIWKALCFFSAFCGANVTKPGYRMTWLTWTLLLIINGAFFLTGYTVYVAEAIENDRIGVLQCLCTVGFALQGYVKLINCIYYKEGLKSVMEDLHEIYTVYNKKHGAYKVCLQQGIRMASSATKYIGLVYFICLLGILLCPIIYYIANGKKVLVLLFYFPGLDHNKNFGFICLTVMHVTCVFFGLFGNFAADMFFIVPIFNMRMLKNIFVCKFHDLNELLESEDKGDRQKIKMTLRDILQWHQQYISYITRLRNSFHWVIAVVILSNTISIILTLFCIAMGEWPGAYSYLFLCVVVLYIYCGLGTVVEVSNEGFIDACYSEVLWYLLSIEEQKMLGIMLMMAQNPQCLTVADVAPLSMSTGLQITKAVYTYTMMLIGVME